MRPIYYASIRPNTSALKEEDIGKHRQSKLANDFKNLQYKIIAFLFEKGLKLTKDTRNTISVFIKNLFKILIKQFYAQSVHFLIIYVLK